MTDKSLCLSFREAALKDAAALALIEKDAFPVERYDGEDIALDEEDFADYLTDRDYKTIVAEDAGKIIGYAIVDISKWDPSAANIDSLAVQKEYRSFGAAFGLLQQAVKISLMKNFNAITFEMHEKNPAIKYLQRYGFEEYEREEGYYSDGGAARQFILRKKSGRSHDAPSHPSTCCAGTRSAENP